MKWLTLDKVKEHCRIDGSSENAILTSYAEAAETGIEMLMSRTYEEAVKKFGDAATKNLTIAALLLTEHMYTHRSPAEGITLSVIPYGIDFWIKPFMKLTDYEHGV